MEYFRYILMAGLMLNAYPVGLPAVTKGIFASQAVGSWANNFCSVVWAGLALWAVYLLYKKRKLGNTIAIICFSAQIVAYRASYTIFGINRGFMELELYVGHILINFTPLIFLFLTWGLWAKNMDNGSKYINIQSDEVSIENA